MIYLKTKSVPLHFFLLQVPRFKQMSNVKITHSIKISGFVANRQAHVDPFCNGNTKRDRNTLAFHNFTTLKKQHSIQSAPKKRYKMPLGFSKQLPNNSLKSATWACKIEAQKKQKNAKRKLMLVL